MENKYKSIMGFIGRNSVYSIEYYKSTSDHREFLRIVVNSQPTSKVLVIMKNPSKTCDNLPHGHNIITTYSDKNKCHIDRTTGKILRKLKNRYDEITIINLYSLYDPDPKNVNAYYYASGNNPTQLMYLNNQCVSSFLSFYSGDVICAWGNYYGIKKTNYDNQINYVVNLLSGSVNYNLLEYNLTTQTFVSVNFNSNLYPLHGLKWK